MGAQTIAAGIALLIAAGLLIWFFATENQAADAASNWFFGIFYVLMGWTIIEVHRFYVDAAGFVWVLTIAGLGVVAAAFVATVLILTRTVEFTRVAVATTLAWVVLILWMLGASVLIVVEGGISSAVGWLGIAVTSVSALAVGATATDRELVRGEKAPGKVLNAVFAVVLGGLTVWIIWLGAASTTPI